MNQQTFIHAKLKIPVDAIMFAHAAIRMNPLDFCAVTERWLQKNEHVWLTFYNDALAVQMRGRRVGAKCIYENMRYQSAVSDSDKTFKLNNNVVSGMARLYNAVTGTDFFETRKA